MTVIYIHDCRIIRPNQTSQDEYGAPVYTDSSDNDPSGNVVTSVCKFYTDNSNSRLIDSTSGEHAVSTPCVMLPASTVINRGYTITSTETGYAHTYTVHNAEPIYRLFTNTIDHYECELEVVE